MVNRPRRLTEAQALELRVWYYSARTAAEKARELGISTRALYDYIFWRHKTNEPSIASHQHEVPRGEIANV